MRKVQIVGGPLNGGEYAFSGDRVTVNQGGRRWVMDVYVSPGGPMGERDEYRALWSERKEIEF